MFSATALAQLLTHSGKPRVYHLRLSIRDINAPVVVQFTAFAGQGIIVADAKTLEHTWINNHDIIAVQVIEIPEA